MGTGAAGSRQRGELPDHYVMVGKRCVVLQAGVAKQAWFTGRNWGGWRVDVDLAEGPVDLRIGTLDGARLLRGHVERDANGAVIRDLQVVAYRQDRAEVRVTRLGQFWVAAPSSGDWALAEVRDLSASGAALVLQEALPLVRVRGEINTDYGHEVTFESAARLVRVAEETVAGIVAVYEFDLDDSQRCALRAAVLWHTSAKRA